MTVTVGWLSSPHSLDITITSVDGDPTDPANHGHQVTSISGLQVLGDISQGQADVIVLWASDENDRLIDDEYRICAHVIFADNLHGAEFCEVFFISAT